MDRITKEQYEFALNRIEDLLPLVTDDTPANDKNAIELTLMSDIVESYEKKHFPIQARYASVCLPVLPSGYRMPPNW